MKKEEFNFMDKINEVNCFEKMNVCEKEFYTSRKHTFE